MKNPFNFKKESGYSSDILEIHNEFDKAGELLLKEAINIINSIKTVSSERPNLLKSSVL